MAKRLRLYQSLLWNAAILFHLAFFPLSKLQETTQYEGEVSTNVRENSQQNVKVYDDFVEIRQSPTSASKNFLVRVDYRCKTARIITMELISHGHEDTEKIEFRYNFAVALRTEKTVTRAVRVKLRDSLVYGDNKALNIVTDLHTFRLKIVVSVVDIIALSLSGQNSLKAAIFASDYRDVLVIPPLRRPDKPGFCYSCLTNYLQRSEERRIHKCEPVNGKTNVKFVF
jgi:hypothetical protein